MKDESPRPQEYAAENRGIEMPVTTIRLIGAIAFWILAIFPCWRIFTKAGFSGWLALLLIVPFVNLVVLYYVAFSNWKIGQSGGADLRL